MANYYGHGRTNYLRFTDEDAVRELCAKSAVTIVKDTTKQGGDVERYALLSDCETGELWYAEDEDAERVELLDLLFPYLVEGEHLVYVSIGSEKMRYLSGQVSVYTCKGLQSINRLSDAYEDLPKHTTRPEY